MLQYQNQLRQPRTVESITDSDHSVPMSFYPRLFWNVFCGKYLDKSPKSLLEHTWKSYAGLTDIDMFMHINNAQYLLLAEYARWTWMTHSGLLAYLTKRGMNPVVTEVTCRYRRQLRLGVPFEIHSKMIHFTNREFYLVHTFNYKGGLAARLLMKFQILKKNEVQDPIEIWTNIQPDIVLPKLDPSSEDYKAVYHFYALESYLLGKPIPDSLSVTPALTPSPQPK
ncbi:putative Thioesterase-like superfamily [Blattamonas nauphoetae]|uniref:Thioesterase-like superfamily n=1 Tax=Blattamonas nauphoetae TaxID=2049346 RepID=A0ABQ9XS03_9EUKA|nr:putative Thioesterase-like superfamily [Blattamonas nauphoetae]